MARQKRQRQQLLAEWQQQKAPRAEGGNRAGGQEPPDDALWEPCPAIAEQQPLPGVAVPQAPLPSNGKWRDVASAPLEWFDAEKRYRCFALAPAFLTQDDMNAIHVAAKHRSVAEINDRKGYLAFKHRVWRFELQLRSLCPRLYTRLMDLMRRVDGEKWRRLRKKSKKVYPEIEYIEYDVAVQGEPCFIEPHVDNKSAVTMVAMLSEPGAYIGGASCFRRADGRRGHREHVLQQGDIVLFRGEKLTHWITPVTAGRRVILQIELSRV